MPTNRTPIGRKSVLKITPESVAAWKRTDFHELHRLLGLKPWEASPLPIEVTALGCCEDDLPVEPNSDRTRFSVCLDKLLIFHAYLL